MKYIKYICDLCGKELTEDMTNKFDAPTFSGEDFMVISKQEFHFCKTHQHFQLVKAYRQWQLNLIDRMNELFTENKWNPSEKYVGK